MSVLDKTKSCLTTAGVLLLKFIAAAFFGALVSLVLLGAAMIAPDEDFPWEGNWMHVLWILPLVWGVLGLFWFDKMLDIGCKLIEGFSGKSRE